MSLLLRRMMPIVVLVMSMPVLGAATESTPSLLMAQAGSVTLDQAVAKVRRTSGGKVVGADTIEQDGSTSYRIKVVFPDGKVRIYYVDPATGEIQS